MSNQNKQKGKRFEEYIADKLRKHFKVDKRFITRAKSSGIAQEEFGDIMIAPSLQLKLPYMIECKFGYELTLEYYIGSKTKNKSNPLRKFIIQVITEYNSYSLFRKKFNIDTELIPVLMFSGAYKDIYVSYLAQYTPKEVIKDIYTVNYLKTKIDNKLLYTVDFKDFLSIVDHAKLYQ